MSSVKNITVGEARENRVRKAKIDAMSKNLIEIDDSDNDDLFSDAIDDNDARVVSKTKKDKKKVAVKVTHIAVDSELNLETQFSKRFQACNRDIFKVNKQNGSANKDKQKYVKVEFQTGMFEVLKKNMIDIMREDFKVKYTKDPKLETYGASKAEEIYYLDLQFIKDGSEYNVKLSVFNTNCIIGIDSTGKGKKVIKAQSVAEFFV